MPREIGQQQKRARIEIGGDQDERCVRRAAHARGKGSPLFPAQQPSADSTGSAIRPIFTHPANEPSHQGGVKPGVSLEPPPGAKHTLRVNIAGTRWSVHVLK